MLNILIEIQQALLDISDTDLARAELSLAAKVPGDKPLGTVQGEAARAIMALSRRYAGSASELAHRADYDVSTEADKTDLQRESHRMVTAAGICLDMFWMEARNEIGGTAWDNVEVGIRKDWLLVRPGKRAMPNLSKLFEFTQE